MPLPCSPSPALPAAPRRRAVVVAAAAALVLPPAQAQAPVVLEVAAASSLADVAPALARLFEAARPGVRVGLRFDASGTLLEQLARGAAWDVLIAANNETITRGVERRLLAADVGRGFATNEMVLVVPAGSLLTIRRLSDLGQPDVLRIAMGRVADVPAGRYARQAIDAQRLWPQLQRKIVDADSARDALARVVRADVEAGFVYRTDALAAGERVRVVETLRGHSPVRYTAAVTLAARQGDLAAAFIEFLRTDAARAVLVAAGFAPI